MKRVVILATFFGFIFGCGGQQTKPSSENATGETGKKAKAAKPIAPKLSKIELDALLASARDRIAEGKLADARASLEEALLQDLDPKFEYFVRYNLGVLSERRGAYDDAQSHYEKAHALDQDSGKPILALAQLQTKQGKPERGIEIAREALGKRPESVSLKNALNRLLVMSQRDLDVVIAASKKILVKDENNAEAMMNMAIAYQIQNRHDMAIDVLTRAEADFKDQRSDLIWRKAKSYLALEQTLAARKILTEAIGSGRTATPELHNLLGLLDLEAGNPAAAEVNFRAALTYSPDMIAACVNLSHALKAGQKYDEALSTLNGCSDRSGGQIDMLYNLGILYLDGKFSRIKGLKQVERAKSYFKEFLEKTKDAERKQLAMTYLGESEKRIKYEKKKIELKARAKKREEARKAREAKEATEKAASDSGQTQSDGVNEATGGGDNGEE